MKRFIILCIIIISLFTAAGCSSENEEAVQKKSREQIKVAIVDTGISSKVISTENICPGKNYLYPEQGTEDRIGHGTACAAFIVGSVPARIDGNCPDARLIPLVYADIDPETGEQTVGGPELAAKAINDAVDAFECDIILISSGTTEDNEVLHDAVRNAREKGIPVFSCAGNSGDTDPDAVFYPGAYDEVFCVGSLDENGNVASFSQNNGYVDIWEKGTDLRLATLKGTKIRGNGTSYSAAIAAGRAARLMLSVPRPDIEEIAVLLTE